jgi:hypothetical protein
MENKFKRITIPLVRRIYPSLIAEKIVSVQRMKRPDDDTRKKIVRPKRYRSIDDPWENA